MRSGFCFFLAAPLAVGFGFLLSTGLHSLEEPIVRTRRHVAKENQMDLKCIGLKMP